MRGKQVCRHHGGKSTGPKTEAGKLISARANLKHGKYSLAKYGQRMIEKLNAKVNEDVHLLEYDVFRQYVTAYIKRMTFEQWREFRGLFAKYVEGQASMRQVIEHIDGKPIKLPEGRPKVIMDKNNRG